MMTALDERIYPLRLDELLSFRRDELRGSFEVTVPAKLCQTWGINDNLQLEADYRVRLEIGKVKLYMRIRADLMLTCDRCLDNFEHHVELEVNETFTDKDLYMDLYCHKGTLELNYDDLSTFYYEDDVLDIGRIALEHVLINLPTKRLCKPNCKGLCPICGVNLNYDTCEHAKTGLRILKE